MGTPMTTSANTLRELHQLHLRKAELADQLQRGPRQVEARRQFTHRKDMEVEAAREKLLALRKTVDEKNLQLKTNENKIVELKGKLNTASSNREYDVLRSQIDADVMANSVLEDEILEVLEKVDELRAQCGELEQESKRARSEQERVAEEVAAREPKLKLQLDEVGAALSEAERALPHLVSEEYRRLVNAHGARALAAVENNACTECYVGLSPQSRVELNSGKLLFCKSCGRLLYRSEEE